MPPHVTCLSQYPSVPFSQSRSPIALWESEKKSVEIKIGARKKVAKKNFCQKLIKNIAKISFWGSKKRWKEGKDGEVFVNVERKTRQESKKKIPRHNCEKVKRFLRIGLVYGKARKNWKFSSTLNAERCSWDWLWVFCEKKLCAEVESWKFVRGSAAECGWFFFLSIFFIFGMGRKHLLQFLLLFCCLRRVMGEKIM